MSSRALDGVCELCTVVMVKRSLLLAALVFAIPNRAHAAPCDTLGLPNIVYAQVGDTQLDTNILTIGVFRDLDGVGFAR